MRINIKACSAAVCLAAALPVACGAAPARRPSVVLVIYDTVRADRTSPYGYAASATPALGKFAEGAVVFEKAYANSNWTGSSFATILTGRRLFSHGLAGFQDTPSADISSMPALLSSQGYETAAFFSGLPGEPGYGFGRGFGRFAVVSATCPFSYQAAAALEWRNSLPPEKDFFLAVHGLDVHNPAGCSGGPDEGGAKMPLIDADFLDYYNEMPNADLARLDPERWKKVLAYKRDPAFLARLSRGYDRCVSQLDKGLAALLRALEEDKGRPLLIIITSDHGQLLGEHGLIGHVSGIYEQLVRVPLLIRFPGGGGGKRVAAVAEHVDLLPTICAAAGIACPVSDGKDLAAPGEGVRESGWATASASGPAGAPRQVRNAAFYGGGKKLARNGFRWELFDLASDPGETKDLSEALPADFLELAAGYLALSGAEKITAKNPVTGESAGNCFRPAAPFEVPAGASPCGRAVARASWLARNRNFDGAAAELAGSGCPGPELLRYREALKLLREELLSRRFQPHEGYAFSTAPGLWQMAKDGYSAAYGPGAGLTCEKDGRPSSAAGCVRPAAALLDCVEKYRFEVQAAPPRNDLEQALRAAGYIQ